MYERPVPPPSGMIVGYVKPDAVCHDHDPRAFEAAARVAAAVRERNRFLQVEHIGSAAICGCAGKGIVDLMILYPAGLLDDARGVLAELGFKPNPPAIRFPKAAPCEWVLWSTRASPSSSTPTSWPPVAPKPPSGTSQ